MAQNFDPKQEFVGNVIRTERRDGVNQTTQKPWSVLDVTIAWKARGKWNSETREAETKLIYAKAGFFGSSEDVSKMASQFRIADPERNIEGSRIKIRAWAGPNTYPDKQTGTWKTTSTLQLNDPEIDWQFFYQENANQEAVETTQEEEDTSSFNDLF